MCNVPGNDDEFAQDGAIDNLLRGDGFNRQHRRWKIGLKEEAYGERFEKAYVCYHVQFFGTDAENYGKNIRFIRAVIKKSKETQIPVVFTNVKGNAALLFAAQRWHQLVPYDGNVRRHTVYWPTNWAYLPNDALKAAAKVFDQIPREDLKNELRDARRKREAPDNGNSDNSSDD